MIKSKNKKCVTCGREDQPWYSKKRCKSCSTKSYGGIKSTPKPIKAITAKTAKKKKEISKDRVPFFKEQIEYIKEKGIKCEECGSSLHGGIDEVAHILSKSKHPEVETEKNNIVYLCGAFSENQCHYNFDKKDRTTMKVFEIAKQRYSLIKNKVKKESNEVRELTKN
jgi:DNA-directed RNA polymerase subunit RPC12/RpoP